MAEIEKQLRHLAEEEPPRWLKAAVMDRIEQRQGLWKRFTNWLCQSELLAVPGLRLATYALTGAICFWLGSLMPPAINPISVTGNIADPALSFSIGRQLLQADHPQQAIDFFQRAIELDPQNSDYPVWQGYAYWQAGDLRAERESYLKALSEQQTAPMALLNLGHNYLALGESEQAISTYRLLLQDHPNQLMARYNLALAQLTTGNQTEAAASFRDFLSYQRQGKWALRAATHLQRLGDTAYAPCRLGRQSLVLNQQALFSRTPAIRQKELSLLTNLLAAQEGDLALQLVVFAREDAELARLTATQLRDDLRFLGAAENLPIQISWFDTPFPATSETDSQSRDQYVLFFLQATTQIPPRSTT